MRLMVQISRCDLFGPGLCGGISLKLIGRRDNTRRKGRFGFGQKVVGGTKQVNARSAGALARTSVRSTLNSRNASDAGAFSRFALIASAAPALPVFRRSVEIRFPLLDRARPFVFTAFVLLLLTGSARAQVRITIDHNDNKTANAEFRFTRVPSPAHNDAGARAILTLVDAEADGNSADISVLNDGLLPDAEDQPRKNFFLNTGSGGGRLRMDLGSVVWIAQINSYSWHSNSRGPQVYRVWASDGTGPNFNAEPQGTIDPAKYGWKSIAIVDTRTDDEDGGQYGVSITDASGSLGKFRYLLFDLYPVEVADNSGNTFYSEIDVVAKK